MRWFVFAILAYLMLAGQIGLAEAAAIDTSFGRLQPWLLLPLAVYIGLGAPTPTALTAWLICGVLVDLTTTWSSGLTLIGPNALGHLAGAYVLLQFRAMLVRRHPLTLATMTLLCGAAAQLVVVAVMCVRVFYEPQPDWTGGWQLVLRGLNLLYSAAFALVLAPVLHGLTPLMGFESAAKRAARMMR